MFKQVRSFALSEKHVVFFYILSKMKKSTMSISGYAVGCAITSYRYRSHCGGQKVFIPTFIPAAETENEMSL